jgi:PAS domain S-box-containing protein
MLSLPGTCQKVQHRLRHKDGTWRWIESSAQNLLGDPNIRAVVVTSRDITERKKAEKALAASETLYRTLFQSANDAVFLHGVKPDGSADTFIAVNDVAVKRMGFSVEEFTALTPADIDASEFVKERRQAVETIRSEGRATFEMVHVAKDGRRIPVEISSRQFVMDDRTFVLSIARDITERKQMEDELRKSRDELEVRVQKRTEELEKANARLRQIPSQLIDAQEEERKRLASELHDSIGQTLAALKFRMEFVNNTLRNGEVEKALRLTEEFIPAIQRSIDETRAIYMGLRPKVLEDFGVIAALFWYREGLLNLNPETHIEIEISIDASEIPQEIVIPIFRIAQEALNNATKHSESEWVDVRLVKNGAQIELVVSDDGVGMDVHQILQNSTARSLGLTSMKERAEITGGKFTIESTPGEGTTIRVFWPTEI